MGFMSKGTRLWKLSVSTLLLAASSHVQGQVDSVFPDDFLFGIATAPGHAEDQLHDMWLDFAQLGHVAAWKNAGHPELRLKFWSEYQTEIDYAAKLGGKIFRMGVDWGRLQYHRPAKVSCSQNLSCYEGVQDMAALAHYQKIIQYARSQGLAVMVTLFHHSVPRWLGPDIRTIQGSLQGSLQGRLEANSFGNDHTTQAIGGWTDPEAPAYFAAFAKDVVTALAADVDLWVIHNEPTIFAGLSYTLGYWPPGRGLNPWSIFKFGPFTGAYHKAFDNLVKAHHQVYQLIKQIDTISTGDPSIASFGPAAVGVAHNISYYQGRGPFGRLIASGLHQLINLDFMDRIIGDLDFMGLNYYGEETPGLRQGLVLREDREYSEAGRAVNPNGLYTLLMEFKSRYLMTHKIPIIITENGTSDSTDTLRAPYLLEHLAAIRAAMDDGVPVRGYIHWTLSDNWEWADGYCPKFGLLAVDRSNPDLVRTPRPSFALYQKIIAQRRVSADDRKAYWEQLSQNFGQPRPFCRATDGIHGLNEPVMRAFVNHDWRFLTTSH